MFTVALTGGIGSGKTTISDLFKSNNIPIIDTDIISREVIEANKPAYSKIIEIFGKEILDENNNINRQALRLIVFGSATKRSQLESILHPAIWQEVALQLSSLTSAYCIVVVPLLVENLTKNKAVTFDRVLVVDTTEKLQIKRAIKRDNCDEETVKNIMKAQVSRQTRLDAADDIIVNKNNLDYLNDKVTQLHKQYLKLSE